MNSTTDLPIGNLTSLVSPTVLSDFAPSQNIIDTTSTVAPSISPCCNNLPEENSQAQFDHASPTTTYETQRAEVTTVDDQGKFHMKKDGFEDYYEEHYSTPISILLLNFFLVMFLMIVIGIAVYPAMKKYCNSTFSFGNNNNDGSNSYWIEDTEEVSSTSALTTPPPNNNESSVAFLNSTNCNSRADVFPSSSSADFNSACDIELLSSEI